MGYFIVGIVAFIIGVLTGTSVKQAARKAEGVVVDDLKKAETAVKTKADSVRKKLPIIR